MVVEPGVWMVNRRPGAEVRAGVGKRRRRAAAGKSVWQLGLAPADGQSRDRRLPQSGTSAVRLRRRRVLNLRVVCSCC